MASGEVTQLLARSRSGDAGALHELVSKVYPELQRLARAARRGARPSETLRTTAVVHEAYLRMVDPEGTPFADRGHFFAVASLAMRQLVVDHARRRGAAKRGGGDEHLPLEEDLLAELGDPEQVLAVHQALEQLEERSPRLGRVVECRFFGGLSEQETAEALGISLRTVQREWLRARAWLVEALGETAGPMLSGRD